MRREAEHLIEFVFRDTDPPGGAACQESRVGTSPARRAGSTKVASWGLTNSWIYDDFARDDS